MAQMPWFLLRMKTDNAQLKHIPVRTCVACRQVKAKRELIRIVRVAEGCVEADPGGKKAGRGAYLCPARECWEAGLRGGRLEHTLRTKLSQENREELLRLSEELLKETDIGKGKQTDKHNQAPA